MGMVRRAILVALAAALLAAGACSRPGTAPAPADPLDGRSFVSTAVLEGGAERELVPGTRIELSFADGRLSARAGCNLLGARYRLAGGVLEIVGGVSTTEMGCDPERHEQDAWLSAFLGASPRVRLEGPDLVLARGGTEIRFLDREVAEPDLPLEGTAWRLETLVEGEVASSVPRGLRATLLVREGRIGGFDGCNEWGARLRSAEGGELEIGPIATTLVGCRGAAAALERDVLAVMRAGRIAYEVDGSTLVLRAGDRELWFRGEPEPRY